MIDDEQGEDPAIASENYVLSFEDSKTARERCVVLAARGACGSISISDRQICSRLRTTSSLLVGTHIMMAASLAHHPLAVRLHHAGCMVI